MLRATLHDPARNTRQDGGRELISAWRDSNDALLWVDLDQSDLAGMRTEMIDGLDLHPLALQDAARDRHPPKLESFDNGAAFLLLKGLDADTDSIDFDTIQIALFVSQRLLVTVHSGHSLSIDSVWDDTRKQAPTIHSQPAAIAARICARITDRYLPILLRLETRLEAMEDEMFRQPRDALLEELVGYKTQLRKLRRVVIYHERIFEQLRHGATAPFDDALRHELIDIYEHLERQRSLADLYYEMASDLIEGYISVASHHLNQIMKVLTVVTAIFIPLGFLAGIYGMNFENMPELHSRYGYFMLLGTMSGIAVILLYIFRRRGWL